MTFLSDHDRLEEGDFRDVAAWQRAMDLSVAIYRVSDRWPRVDPLDLVEEIRRNAVMIPAIIARGFATGERNALLHCLQNALDTAKQIDAQLELGLRVGYCSEHAAKTLQQEIAGTMHEIGALQHRYRTH